MGLGGGWGGRERARHAVAAVQCRVNYQSVRSLRATSVPCKAQSASSRQRVHISATHTHMPAGIAGHHALPLRVTCVCLKEVPCDMLVF